MRLQGNTRKCLILNLRLSSPLPSSAQYFQIAGVLCQVFDGVFDWSARCIFLESLQSGNGVYWIIGEAVEKVLVGELSLSFHTTCAAGFLFLLFRGI